MKSTPFTDIIISGVCGSIFSAVLAFYYARLGAAMEQILPAAAKFFIGITVMSFAVLRILAGFSHKKKEKEA